ncbi:hypothetical protein PQA64_gp52 [Burkholderia phage PhiBP82.2]|nr:hypothetical protein PQA64_gp52 [Burkholderia phage PhiBP82.2]UKM53811.1 hypothetical protein PhiBP822_53 [Burkholderia phage PhiBP82.2]
MATESNALRRPQILYICTDSILQYRLRALR